MPATERPSTDRAPIAGTGSDRACLIVFAREPELGRVKSRLAEAIGTPAALSVYRVLLRRTLQLANDYARANAIDLACAITGGENGQRWLHDRCARRGIRTVAQRGNDLGSRMLNAMRDVAGASQVVLIGADCPVLEARDLALAFDAVREADAVIAPTEDGGYVLIGVSGRSLREAGALFTNIEWGSARVATQTQVAADHARLALVVLRELWDVDRVTDLDRWRAIARPGSTSRRVDRTRLALLAAVLATAYQIFGFRRSFAGDVASSETKDPTKRRAQTDDSLKTLSPSTGAALVRFSGLAPGDLPADARAGWHLQSVRGAAPNRVFLSRRDGRTVLEIESKSSASAVIHRVPSGLRGATRLRWRWQISAFPNRSVFGERESDDFPARLYVIFDYPIDIVPFVQRLGIRVARTFYGDVPAAALVYVWHRELQPETMSDSPYTSRVRMIVARSDSRVGVWQEETRDIAEDFQRAFGQEFGPGMAPVGAIALGADTDQSGGVLSAFFGDVELS